MMGGSLGKTNNVTIILFMNSNFAEFRSKYQYLRILNQNSQSFPFSAASVETLLALRVFGVELTHRGLQMLLPELLHMRLLIGRFNVHVLLFSVGVGHFHVRNCAGIM